MSNQGNINNMNNKQVYSPIQDNGIYNNQPLINKNIIYTTYQNVSTQPSIVGQQGQQVNLIQTSQVSSYQQYPQTQYINKTSFPSPVGVNINNDKLVNSSNQSKNILYSPVSTASSASPSISNTFNSTESTNIDPINKNTTSLSSSVINSNFQENNSTLNPSNANANTTGENKIPLVDNTDTVIDNKSKSQPINNSNTTTTLYTSYSNINSNINSNSNTNTSVVSPSNNDPSSTMNQQQQGLSPSMNNNAYLIKTQTQTIYSTNKYVTQNANTFIGTNINNSQYKNQISNQTQVTSLPVTQQNIGMISNATIISQQPSNPQIHSRNTSFVIQQNIPQNNQNIMIINNSQGNVQSQPVPAVYQNTSTYSQVYSNGQCVGQIQNTMLNQPFIFNNINGNILFEQQKVLSMELAIKRKKNTEAARRSRMRKMLRMENLEKYVKQLENENSSLNMRIAILEGNRPEWNEQETKLRDRIRELERELTKYKSLKRKLDEEDKGKCDKEDKTDKKVKQESDKELIEIKKEE
ncbi:hypothetical protein H8356DRAFT_1377240 [Neocallimastix lanati (nom. inval.)]|uniref:BZIP domain-containing protein n=1 Tax=Neocallimastix californiae TaxID=1754190 RepID=A0A1Y2EHF1_9FUNG|nr:hypothetical protein H8356DRAFT_1377240 [Neocallimastix sp. JGI-2020a]ORY70696.1 hypothetical protein LY90DRAFT_504031 [Neocallimastix californiae]|eukprot:ORY70696.1 hypothetical protein LY90DRAFT_504031 [Neocallimastix californiae]